MNIIAGLSEISATVGSSSVSLDKIVRLAAPKSFTGKDLTKLRRDCEILLQRIQKDPKGLQEMVRLGLTGDLAAAARMAASLKLREEDFEKEGGGFLILIIVLVILLWPQKAY